MKRIRKKHSWNWKDITGNKFGMLTVISFKETKHGLSFWECKCSCGRIKVIRINSLTSGNSKSCGICVNSGENNNNFSKKVKVNCGFCGKKLEKIPSVAKKYKMFFCNQKCRSEYIRSQPKQSHYNWKGGRDYMYRIKNLSGCYIKSLIQANTKIKREDIPQSLVNIKREEIKTKRLLKELTS